MIFQNTLMHFEMYRASYKGDYPNFYSDILINRYGNVSKYLDINPNIYVNIYVDMYVRNYISAWKSIYGDVPKNMYEIMYKNMFDHMYLNMHLNMCLDICLNSHSIMCKDFCEFR